MTDRNRIDVADGKYTVLGIEDGHLRALRHGEEWRSLTGDNLIFALAVELQEARDAALAVIEKVRGIIHGPSGLTINEEKVWMIVHNPTAPADALREHDAALIEGLADELEQQGVEPWDRTSVAIRTLRWKAHQRREGQS